MINSRYRTSKNQEHKYEKRQPWFTNVSEHSLLQRDSVLIPVTTITRITAKAMLPPSCHPSSIPYDEKISVKSATSKNALGFKTETNKTKVKIILI